MSIETVTYAAHTAYLHTMMGVGILVVPLLDDDVPTPVVTRHPLPGREGITVLDLDSLHDADWNAAMRDLYARGWELTEDDNGDDVIDGYMPDGRPCLSLYGRDPIVSEPGLDEIAEAWHELRQAIGFEPGSES